MKKILILLLCLVLLLCGCSEIVPEAGSTEPLDNAPAQSGNEETPDQSKLACDGHVDNDDNDICDLCGGSVIVVIDIFSINDLHGKIMDADSHPGVDELTTYLDNAREEGNVILLSAGDMWQGSAESNTTKGELMTEWMNGAGFDAMALGNHEFDWGEEYIANNSEIAEFPLLAINVYERANQQRADYCESSVMIQREGVKIGIIGAIGDCYSSVAPDHTKGIYFQTGQHLTSLVKKESKALREQGADFIIYVIHDGYGENIKNGEPTLARGQLGSFYDDTLSDGYVDLVFEAHTHRTYTYQDQYGVYHMQHGGDNNGGISHAEVRIHAIDGTWQVVDTDLVKTSEYEHLEDSPLISNLLDEYADQLAASYDAIGNLNHACLGDDLRQKVADLYYEEGMERWGDAYDIVLGGGFISIRDPGYLPRGPVTYAQLMGLFPFDNELVLCSVKGRDLLEKFFESTHYNYFISYSDYGADVWENLDPNGTYYIVVDTYTSTYAPNNLTEIERAGDGRYARDMLADYIADGGFN